MKEVNEKTYNSFIERNRYQIHDFIWMMSPIPVRNWLKKDTSQIVAQEELSSHTQEKGINKYYINETII